LYSSYCYTGEFARYCALIDLEYQLRKQQRPGEQHSSQSPAMIDEQQEDHQFMFGNVCINRLIPEQQKQLLLLEMNKPMRSSLSEISACSTGSSSIPPTTSASSVVKTYALDIKEAFEYFDSCVLSHFKHIELKKLKNVSKLVTRAVNKVLDTMVVNFTAGVFQLTESDYINEAGIDLNKVCERLEAVFCDGAFQAADLSILAVHTTRKNTSNSLDYTIHRIKEDKIDHKSILEAHIMDTLRKKHPSLSLVSIMGDKTTKKPTTTKLKNNTVLTKTSKFNFTYAKPTNLRESREAKKKAVIAISNVNNKKIKPVGTGSNKTLYKKKKKVSMNAASVAVYNELKQANSAARSKSNTAKKKITPPRSNNKKNEVEEMVINKELEDEDEEEEEEVDEEADNEEEQEVDEEADDDDEEKEDSCEHDDSDDSSVDSWLTTDIDHEVAQFKADMKNNPKYTKILYHPTHKPAYAMARRVPKDLRRRYPNVNEKYLKIIKADDRFNRSCMLGIEVTPWPKVLAPKQGSNGNEEETEDESLPLSKMLASFESLFLRDLSNASRRFIKTTKEDMEEECAPYLSKDMQVMYYMQMMFQYKMAEIKQLNQAMDAMREWAVDGTLNNAIILV